MSIILTKHFGVYVDWTKESTPRPFYVGKGKQGRINYRSRNHVHSAIRAKYGCDRRLAFETDDENEAFEHEQRLIAELHTYAGDGWGANFTYGGEGHTRHHTSEQHKQRISEALKRYRARPDVKEKTSQVAKEMFARPEVKAKLGQKGSRHHGTKLTEADVMAMREAHAQGASYREISERFNVTYPVAWGIVTRRGWTHVP